MSQINLRTPADILAAAPCLVGFVPTNSLVIYMLARGAAGGIGVYCALRVDIDPDAEYMPAIPTDELRSHDAVAAIMLAICDQRHDGQAHTLLDTWREMLQNNGIRVVRRLHTRNVTEAGQWLDVDTGDYGATYPYTDSTLSAHAVLDGRQIRRSRSDIAADFAYLPPAPEVDVENSDYKALALITAKEIDDILINGTAIASPTLPTRAGMVITGHPVARDAMIGLAVKNPRAAADLWTFIGRRLRGQHRAEALTLAAACLCLDSDTVRAGIAIEAALEEADTTSTPRPKLARLLETALRAGLNPATIRDTLIQSTAEHSGSGAPATG